MAVNLCGAVIGGLPERIYVLINFSPPDISHADHAK